MIAARLRGVRAGQVAAPLLLAAWTTVLASAFGPGLVSADTLDMLRMGTTGAYNTQHSALLSLGIGVVYRLFGTIFPLLLLQLLALGGGVYALTRRSTAPRAAFAVLAVFLLLPPVWSTAIAVWKDVAMAAALLLAVVALDLRRPWVALVLLLLAGTFRLNALAASLPLVVVWALNVPGLAASRWRKAAAMAAALAAAVVTPKLANVVLQAKDSHTAVWVVTYDLAGIYVARPEAYQQSMLARSVDVKALPALYHPGSSVPLFYAEPGAPHFSLEALGAQEGELTAEWRRVIAAYPGTYLANRFFRFSRLLGIGTPWVHYPFHVGIDPNPHGFALRDFTLVHRGLRAVQEATRNSLLFRGWLWLLAALAVTGFAVKRAGLWSLPAWTGLSGLGYALGYLAAGPAADFRYLFWMVVSVFCALALLLPRPASAADPPAPAP